MQDKLYAVYFMANQRNTVLYLGISSDLPGRVYKHKNKFYPNSFTARYNVDKLVYYEMYSEPTLAITREKQLKHWNRDKKLALIKKKNPLVKDLSDEL